jgi:hypothetical protein
MRKKRGGILRRCTFSARRARQPKPARTEVLLQSSNVYTIKCQVPKTGSYTAHYEDKHEVKEKERQQRLIKLLTNGIALQQRTKVAAPVEAATLEGLDMVPFVSACELDVEQQVDNTCAPRALITALESSYCPTELEATSFEDID